MLLGCVCVGVCVCASECALYQKLRSLQGNGERVEWSWRRVKLCTCVYGSVSLTLYPSHITINNELKWNLWRDETRLEL